MRYAILILCGLLFTTSSWAQRPDFKQAIFGVAIDEKEQAPLIGAHVALYKAADGAEVGTTVTNERGRFFFRDVENGNYKLEITYVGYQTFTKTIEMTGEMVRVGRVAMKESATKLKEVVVEGKIVRAEQLGDTTSFNAAAYKTNPDASAEDLIKKMPGIVTNNGTVEAQGENVGRVLVDGREFFGNDPTAALRNLPAEVIDKIQVFDQQSDQSQFTGFDDGNTTKTINIVTKSNARIGQFGKIYAGYGPDDEDDVYKAGGSVNIFNKDMRLSIIGQSNNINIQNFSNEDLLGILGSGGGRGRRGGFGGGRRGGGNASNFIVGTQNGISTTHAVGLNYSDKWGEKVEVTGSYFFNQSENVALEDINRQFFNASDTGQVYRELRFAESKNINHRLNMRIDYKINKTDEIRIRPRLTIQDNSGFDNTFGETALQTSLLNATQNDYNSDLNGINFSNSILYRHRFAKARRTIAFNLTTGYNSNNGESFLFSENSFFGRTTQIESLNQFSDLLSDGWNVSTSVSYTEPIGKMGMLMFQYRAAFNQTDSDRETFDFDDSTDDYDILNPQLSNVFTSDYNTHSLTTSYMTRAKNTVFMLRATAETATLDNEQTFPNPLDLKRNFFNILPMAMFRYQWSRQKNIRVFYRTNTQEPSINQLQEVVDNSNPIQLSTGNPGLRQSFQHNVFIRYTNTNTEKATVFYTLLSGGYTNNYIGNQTFIAESDDIIVDGISLPRGSQLIRPSNLDGFWNLRSFVTYGVPVGLLKSNLNFNISGTYNRIPGLINEETNFSNSTNFGLGAVLSSNISEKVDFTISSRSNLSFVDNTLQTQLNQEYFTQSSDVALNLIFGPGLVFRTNLTHQLFTGLSDEFNQNFFLWNIGVAKKIFKNQRGEIQLSIFDLLEQNNSINRTVTDAYIEDVRNVVLQQYFMLTFTYQLRNFGQAPANNNNRERRPWERW